MNTVRMPKTINFGKDALSETQYPKNALVVTTAPPDVSAKWLARMKIQDYMLYDKVEPEPSIETVNKVMAEFKPKNPSVIIGLGGGSSLDVAKYAGMEMKIPKILIPTTFGTGAEMTTYCVLKFEGKKKLLQDERFLADMAVIDAYFIRYAGCRALRGRSGHDGGRAVQTGRDRTGFLCDTAAGAPC